MGDEEEAATDQPSWWASGDNEDATVLASPFDEPVAWPEAISWPSVPPPSEVTEPEDALPPPAPIAGGDRFDFDDYPESSPGEPEAALLIDALPESIWDEAAGDGEGTAAVPSTAFYAETEVRSSSSRGGRSGFNLQHSRAAGIGVAALVGLVLIGLLYSMQHHPDLPTDPSKGDAAARILAQGLLPSTTKVATTTTTIGIGSGLPLADVAAPGAVTSIVDPPPSTAAPRGGTPAAATPTRAATPTGGGNGTATPTQTTGTTSAPQTETTTQTTTTSPPSDSIDPGTTVAPVNTTRPRVTPPPIDFTVPTFTVPPTDQITTSSRPTRTNPTRP